LLFNRLDVIESEEWVGLECLDLTTDEFFMKLTVPPNGAIILEIA
jgi:hypothetical protein